MKLVVTADDLGLSSGVTRGVLDAHRRGIVRSASLLVTFPAGEEAATLARQERGLEVGLHLDLVGGRPASDPARVRGLIGRDGAFRGLAGLIGDLATRVTSEELATEIRAQISRARAWGAAALSLDSHRHVHTLPRVARVVAAVAREEGVRWVRRPRAARLWSGWRPVALRAATAMSAGAYGGLAGNDWYVDLSRWLPRNTAALVRLTELEGDGELGAHPGYSDDEGMPRSRDLTVLTDPAVIAALGPLVRARLD